ncbi:AIM24 family protein [Salidesulfovibrio brasiliensis]
MSLRGKFEVTASKTASDGTVFEVLELQELKAYWNTSAAERLYFANKTGMKAKMVRIRIENSKIRLEPGALYFMQGNLEMKTSSGGGMMKGLLRKTLSGETFWVNEISGTGDIYLEPTFGHYFLHDIGGLEGGVIVDKGFFYAGSGDLDISICKQKKISAGFFGGKGFFQTKISGIGIAVVLSPVPLDEVEIMDLSGGKLSVDGPFAFMRSENVEFAVQKSSKSWFSTSVSGEGFLHTYSGSGKVWMAPTQSIYERLTYVPVGMGAAGGRGGGGGGDEDDGDYDYDDGDDD